MLKAGFIGMGRMGITHYSILNYHPSVRIVAVCDQSKLMLKLFEKYLHVLTFTEYEKMLEECEFDFVVISTPSSSHADIAEAAINHNIHTFVEKPFTLNLISGKETIKHLEGKELVNQVGYVSRFHDVFLQVKRLLDADLIGEIKNFRSEMYGCIVLKNSGTSWRGKTETGGGCMYEFASHAIDLVVYLVGEPDKVAGSVLQQVYSSGVEDIVFSNFIYDKGYSGTLMVNWSDESYRKPTNRIEIFGKKGKIIADLHAFKIFLKEPDESKGFKQGWNTRYVTDFADSVRFDVRGNEFTRQLDYFVDCIEQKRTDNISSFAEALKTDIIMEEIIRDAAISLAADEVAVESSPILPNRTKQLSIWEKLLKLIGR